MSLDGASQIWHTSAKLVSVPSSFVGSGVDRLLTRTEELCPLHLIRS